MNRIQSLLGSLVSAIRLASLALFSVCFAALMGFLPVTAHAHGTVAYGTPNVVHACRVLVGGAARIISSGNCLVVGGILEESLHWNVTGPKGPQGATGPAGPAGSPDTADQVRDKFFQGMDCVGNDASDTMVKVGPLCVDVYEASVWSTATGGTQYGTSADNYPCTDSGNNCTSIFARSVAGVTPSSRITWFQAQQACMNAGKRLLTNVEWQGVAAGTPDSASCNGSSGTVAATGSLATCVSNHGVNDMVGNLWEWVGDWVPLSTACPTLAGSDDINCFAGASTTAGPGALARGGYFDDGADAGVFAVSDVQPSSADSVVGFRCAH